MPFVMTPVVSHGKRARLAAEDIHADYKQAVTEALAWSAANAEGKLAVELGTEEAANDFLHAVRSAAYHHEPRLVVTGNPLKGGIVRFRVDVKETPATEA